jgi:acyl-CoA synthetase (NDP forming)
MATNNAFYALHPRSIAVIGVSGGGRQGLTGASSVFSNLQKFGYPGKIFPVNPKYDEIDGVKCYKSVKDIGEPVDMVVIGIAAKYVPDILRECGETGVKAAIIVGSGFAEIKEGEALQQEVVDIASASGIRIIGPNCLGMINSHEKIVANTSGGLWCGKVSAGNIGLVSQSGALISSLIPRAEDLNMGYSFIVSSGNEADLKLADYVELLLEDQNTYVIVAFAEGLKDHRRLAELAERALDLKKPLLIYKVGKSERAAASVKAHTGSLAGSNQVTDAFLKQHGIIRLDETDEIYESAYLFTKKKLMNSNRIAVITTSGGAGGVICDICEEEKLLVPELSVRTQERLKEVLPYFGSAINPVDMTGAMTATPEKLKDVIRIVDEDSNIDAIVMSITGAPPESSYVYSRTLAEFYPTCSKPLIVCYYTGEMNKADMSFMCESGVPSYYSYRSGLRALKRLYQWSQLASREQTKQNAAEITPKKLADYVEFSAGQSTMTESESKTLFSKFGLPVAKGKLVTSSDAAVAAADEFDYPVVLKVVSTEIAHKSDMGGVKLNLKTPDEVRNAYAEIESAVAATGKQYDGVLVEKMIVGGVEVIAGITTDIQFGPTVVFGSGGIYTEVYKDAAMRVCPIDRDEAMEMIQETKVYKILKGIRGKSPCDIEELAATLVKLSEFALSFQEEVREVDINPLIVREEGKGVVAADALIVVKD